MKKLLTIVYIILLMFIVSACGKKVDNQVFNENKGKVSAMNEVASSGTVDISISSSSGDALKAKKNGGKNTWKFDKNEGADMGF